MSVMSNPTQKDPERAFALQKYLILHSQHDALQKQLDQLLPSYPTAEYNFPRESREPFRHLSASSRSSSIDSDESFPTSPPSAYRHHRGGSSSWGSSSKSTSPTTRSRACSLPTVVDEETLVSIQDEESKLKDVNLQIKATLTDLLNCESVKNDKNYRMWVQSRLMDAEKELKDCKSRSCERRRSDGDDPVRDMMKGEWE